MGRSLRSCSESELDAARPGSDGNSLLIIGVEARKAARLTVGGQSVNDKVGAVSVITHGEFNCNPRHVESALGKRKCMFHGFQILLLRVFSLPLISALTLAVIIFAIGLAVLIALIGFLFGRPCVFKWACS